MSKVKLSESEKNDSYGKGHEDGKEGEYNPPKGDTLTDVVFAPLDAVSGTPSTHEVADAQSPHYRAGHSAGSHSKADDDDKESEDKDEKSDGDDKADGNEKDEK